jgi:hypothetical protein
MGHDGIRVAEELATKVRRQPGYPVMGEVVTAPVAVVNQPSQELGVGRYPGAEPDLEAPPGQHVGH